MLILYGLFVLLICLALSLARWVKSRHSLQLQASMLSPLGSLYTLTTAFLLSNVIFQFTNLRTAITQEVVTISKLGAVMSVLPPEQRVEARRLLYDYAESIAQDEAITMRTGQPSDVTQLSSDRLRDFLSTVDAVPPETLPKTPELVNYFRKVSDLGFDLIDARERRLSLCRQTFPVRLWMAIAVMFFALALLAFLVHNGAWTTTWVATILLLAAPVPAVMLYIYSNPISLGLIDITALLEAVMERSRG
ncbi:DUF4239 domain-containing protein [Synechococcus sp. FGCU-3]|jgi:hypothetical protein|nr:DUF4239 domain-containing protein [Synechococcus sp. FGCU3]